MLRLCLASLVICAAGFNPHPLPVGRTTPAPRLGTASVPATVPVTAVAARPRAAPVSDGAAIGLALSAIGLARQAVYGSIFGAHALLSWGLLSAFAFTSYYMVHAQALAAKIHRRRTPDRSSAVQRWAPKPQERRAPQQPDPVAEWSPSQLEHSSAEFVEEPAMPSPPITTPPPAMLPPPVMPRAVAPPAPAPAPAPVSSMPTARAAPPPPAETDALPSRAAVAAADRSARTSAWQAQFARERQVAAKTPTHLSDRNGLASRHQAARKEADIAQFMERMSVSRRPL